jgi:hypothetical protein
MSEKNDVPLHDQMTVEALLTSLRSTVCPSCGGRKKTMQTLCPREYMSLPREMKKSLWRRIGHGYKEAVYDAFVFFDLVEYRLPPAPVARG